MRANERSPDGVSNPALPTRRQGCGDQFNQACGQEAQRENRSGEQGEGDPLKEIEIDWTQGFRVRGSGFRIIDEDRFEHGEVIIQGNETA